VDRVRSGNAGVETGAGRSLREKAGRALLVLAVAGALAAAVLLPGVTAVLTK
jgi:hypothetical protein